jgi:hypothetical protein
MFLLLEEVFSEEPPLDLFLGSILLGLNLGRFGFLFKRIFHPLDPILFS